MIPFKPYMLPTPAALWGPRFNVSEAEAFIAPRGDVWVLQIPKGSTRVQVFSFEMGFRVYNSRAQLIKPTKKMSELARRVPKNSIIEAFVSEDNVLVSDILYFFDKDLRKDSFESRMAAWWYMPKEYKSMVFFNETNSYRLNSELYNTQVDRLLFKPNFVTYPTKYKKVQNWLQLGRPINDGIEGNATGLGLRTIGPKFVP